MRKIVKGESRREGGLAGVLGDKFEFWVADPQKELPSQGAAPLEIPRSQKLGVMTFASTAINRVSQWSRRKKREQNLRF
jgi:hypothetical protein